MDAAAVIAALGLSPHPEGGHYRETFRDPRTDPDGRAVSTAILFLLGAGEVSEWHRVDAAEIWHWHAGAPLVLTLSPDGHDASARHLGPALLAGQTPQLVVPAGERQELRAFGQRTTGDQAASAAASPSNSTSPSVPPTSGSIRFSGCGMRPSTFSPGA